MNADYNDYVISNLTTLLILLCNEKKQPLYVQRERERERERERDRETETETDRETDRQTERQTDRQTDRQTNRQTDRQTDRQKGGGREREKVTGRQTECLPAVLLITTDAFLIHSMFPAFSLFDRYNNGS